MMSSCNSMDVVPEQVCYIPCNFCNIVLAVSVPCSSLFDIVTVRCGHCSNLWSVNMAAASFHSLSWQHLLHQGGGSSNNHTNNNNGEYKIETSSSISSLGGSSSSSKCLNVVNNLHTNRIATRPPTTTRLSADHHSRLLTRPPEKRQRVPSAYNQFIKEEIQRIKANNPDISHREAFSTAAKNWAHFPHIHFGLMLDTNNNQAMMENGTEKHLMSSKAALLNK